MIRVEICVEDLPGAQAAQEAGADRIELCADLSRGGLTPSLGMVAQVLTGMRIEVGVMIRPRDDFLLERGDLPDMLASIAAIRALPGRAGFVLGALTHHRTVDLDALAALRSACGAAPVTFHKAFDATADRSASLEALCGLGVDRVLTAGGAGLADPEQLRALVAQARARIAVVAAGGIRTPHLPELLATGVAAVHRRGGPPEELAAFVRAARG